MRTALLPALLACALASGPALAQAGGTGSAPAPLVGTPAAGPQTPPVVTTVPGGVVGVVSQPAPGVAPGAPLPVGPNGPVTAGMSFGGPQPATGHNSFTRVQAARRIAAAGFSNVSALRRDGHGVWRGRASHDGAPVGVWLDYTGQVGVAS